MKKKLVSRHHVKVGWVTHLEFTMEHFMYPELVSLQGFGPRDGGKDEGHSCKAQAGFRLEVRRTGRAEN